jgi:hypothetical protein
VRYRIDLVEYCFNYQQAIIYLFERILFTTHHKQKQHPFPKSVRYECQAFFALFAVSPTRNGFANNILSGLNFIQNIKYQHSNKYQQIYLAFLSE